MRRVLASSGIGLALLLVAAASGSHAGPGGDNHDYASGSGTNTFPTGGPAHLMVSAHSDPSGANPTGHVRAKGNLFTTEFPGPFTLEGEVTCLRVEPGPTGGTRAAIKYRFKHAEGSAATFEGGGVQVFLEDNGNPQGGVPVDRNTFDPPQTAATFTPALAAACDSPNSRFNYDPIDAGNYVVQDAP
jgi:hypothetical protein